MSKIALFIQEEKKKERERERNSSFHEVQSNTLKRNTYLLLAFNEIGLWYRTLFHFVLIGILVDLVPF